MTDLRIIFVTAFLHFTISGFSQVTEVCIGDTIDFRSSPFIADNDFEWEFILDPGANIIGGQNDSILRVYFDNPGDYILQFREFALTNCFGVVEQNIRVLPNPIAAFENNPICVYDSASFINNSFSEDGIQSTIWKIGNQYFDDYNLNYVFNEAGDYLVELSIISNSGCSDQEALQFNIADRPTADFYFTPEKITTLNPEVNFFNLSNVGTVWWDFGDSTSSYQWQPNHIYESPGWFDVTLHLTDDLGCQDSITKSILVSDEIIFYLPTSFTPDGDGVNDTFGPKGYLIDTYTSYELKIFNRWGECIFISNDLNYTWDGTKNNRDVQTGLYHWSLRVTNSFGKKVREIGELTLIR